MTEELLERTQRSRHSLTGKISVVLPSITYVKKPAELKANRTLSPVRRLLSYDQQQLAAQKNLFLPVPQAFKNPTQCDYTLRELLIRERLRKSSTLLNSAPNKSLLLLSAQARSNKQKLVGWTPPPISSHMRHTKAANSQSANWSQAAGQSLRPRGRMWQFSLDAAVDSTSRRRNAHKLKQLLFCRDHC